MAIVSALVLFASASNPGVTVRARATATILPGERIAFDQSQTERNRQSLQPWRIETRRAQSRESLRDGQAYRLVEFE